MLLVSCSAVRYVQDGEYKLIRNSLTITSNSSKEKYAIKKQYPEDYIQQRPNSRFLGIGLKTAFYNATDSSKHDGWHRFWSEKVGEKPVILDYSEIEKSKMEIGSFLSSKGYFNSVIDDTVITHGKKAIVQYSATMGSPYRLRNIYYRIEDEFLTPIIMKDTINSCLKSGNVFSTSDFEQERRRLTSYLNDKGFFGFGVNYISYSIDSTVGNHQCDVRVRVRKYMKTINSEGVEVMENHPVYRISSIVVNTEFDGTDTHSKYDSIVSNGIIIKFKNHLKIRPDILLQAIRMSPNEFYDRQSIEKTRANLETLGLNNRIVFNLVESADSNDLVITNAFAVGPQPSTTQHELSCEIQCTPVTRQSTSADFEASTTSQYFSLALSLGYQNNNIFRGGEQFNINFRGAYEFMWQQGKNNSYELGFNSSIVAPRFWANISEDKAARFNDPHSKVSLTFSAQRRPDYSRIVFGGSFGYSWKIGSRSYVTINPLDVYMVSVPRIDSSFLASIQNPYLRNSYTSQLIPGGSVSYVYNNNMNFSQDNFSIKVSSDYAGNCMRLLSGIFLTPQEEYIQETSSIDSYYQILGIRFAQYARLNFQMTGRKNVGNASQLAWRFLVAGGYAYGNTQSLPFERLYFAGGGNSMRGWQMRTLGPGSVQIDSLGVYPNQLGDFKLEANFEYRARLFAGLSTAIFFDLGNIWMNSKGESRSEARFNFQNFYKQLAFNTGIGFRYNIADMMILRLDWGFKLHNPNMIQGERWLHNLGISDTAIHFAIGLPF